MQILLSKDRKKGMKKKNRTKRKEISQRGSAAAWHCLLVQARKHDLAKTKATLMPKASTITATPILQKRMAAPFLTALWGALWHEIVKFLFVLTKMIEWYIAARDWISWGHHFLSLAASVLPCFLETAPEVPQLHILHFNPCFLIGFSQLQMRI